MGLYRAHARVRSFNKHVSWRHQTSPVTQSQKRIHRLQKKVNFAVLALLEMPISREGGSVTMEHLPKPVRDCKLRIIND